MVDFRRLTLKSRLKKIVERLLEHAKGCNADADTAAGIISDMIEELKLLYPDHEIGVEQLKPFFNPEHLITFSPVMTATNIVVVINSPTVTRQCIAVSW